MEDFQRHSQRIRGIALGVLFTLGIAAIVGVVVILKLRHANSTSTNGTTSITVTQVSPGGVKRSAPPLNFRSVALDPINANVWWILGVVPCQGGLCPQFAVTYDGGTSYQSVPAPQVAVPTTAALSALRQGLAFANATDGYAALSGTLYLTTDGGAHWSPAGLSGTVRALRLGSDHAFALVTTASGSTEALGSPLGTTNWTTLPATGNQLVVSGRHLWLEMTHGGTAPITSLSYSANDGSTFQALQLPSGEGCHILPAEGPVWTTCDNGTTLSLTYSSSPTATPTAVSPPNISCQTTSELIPTSTSDALLACDAPGTGVHATSDVGGHWHQVLAPLSSNGHWRLLGSPTDPSVVLAAWEASQSVQSLADASAFVVSSDGGASWSRVDVPPFSTLLPTP
jgi:hypothetical protein